jgi:hypothetical protein
MTDRNLEITTVTVSTELRDDIKEWRDERGCTTMHEALFDLYQEATE